MMKYLILQNPGHNRVYYNSADKLALAELSIATKRLSKACHRVEILELKGVRYLAVEVEQELTAADFEILTRLSFALAIFEFTTIDGEDFLLPKEKAKVDYLDPKVNNILKYQGKTNELFTRMMIHVALLASNFKPDDGICLLDPIAGKGTTLFEAAVYGFDAYGVELDPKPVHDSVVFFRKFLEAERMKHKLDKHRIYGTNKNNAVMINEFHYARTKDELTQNQVKRMGMVAGNTEQVKQFFKNEQFHLIVGDLPYGISHESSFATTSRSGSRNPIELIRQSVSPWYQVLRKGGAIAMAWNSFVLEKHQLAKAFESAGFEVLTHSPFDDFEHRVDQAIRRDLLVARKN